MTSEDIKHQLIIIINIETEPFFFLFYPVFTCVRLRACLGKLLPQSYCYSNLSEGVDRVGGELRGDKECPFSGVTKSDRVWRKVPESHARIRGSLEDFEPRIPAASSKLCQNWLRH